MERNFGNKEINQNLTDFNHLEFSDFFPKIRENHQIQEFCTESQQESLLLPNLAFLD